MQPPIDEAVGKLKASSQLLFERNPLPMWAYDVATLRMLIANKAAQVCYGYSHQEFVQLTLPDLHHAVDLVALQDYLNLPADQRAAHRTWRQRHHSGDSIDVEIDTEDIEIDGIPARLVLARDVTEQRSTELAQHALIERLTSTLKSITDAFFTLDLQWRFTYINLRAEEMLHSSRDAMLGSSVWEKFSESAGGIFRRECELALAQNRPASFETFYDPLKIWLEVRAYPSAYGLTVYFRDITSRRIAEQQLHEERQSLAAVINSATDAIISTDVEGRIKLFNPAAERIFRVTRESIEGQNVEVLIPARYQAAHLQLRRSFSHECGATRKMGIAMVKGLRSDGYELDLEGTISHVTINEEKVLIASLRDVTERVISDAQHQKARTQLSELTKKLMAQEKMLIKRIAQGLHDQLGQTLAAIRMAHDTMVVRQPDNASSEINQLSQRLGTLINQAIHQVRQVLINLHPTLLDEQGLAAALDNELRNRALTQPQTHIVLDVKPTVAAMRWPADVEYAAFMIAREAVENALRHSGATSVSVLLSGGPLSLRLEVLDDGVGLTGNPASPAGHLGIAGMHERAKSIGAAVAVGSGHGCSTRVSLSWQPSP
jgi:PAS domain S-box-containing protein